ncbi:hypothetical protein YC2023_081337 [Brassica napus]|uniref:Uncharacterized protein n=1 Tax=Brassica oleracea TaxID=3712 RepID=A0A3P6EIC8_BRAOL|nr:unnamed protein product [Brassica oleracea]
MSAIPLNATQLFPAAFKPSLALEFDWDNDTRGEDLEPAGGRLYLLDCSFLISSRCNNFWFAPDTDMLCSVTWML